MALSSKQVLAVNKMIRSSSRKLNLVAAQIRGLPVHKAIQLLELSPKGVAKDVRKTLLSAIANAENNHNLDIDALKVVESSVGKAMVMKRFMPRARGRASPILKPFSRLRIVVEECAENGEVA
jgi:large subunit ribosomal protein L22